MLENPPAFQREPPAMKLIFFFVCGLCIVFMEPDLVLPARLNPDPVRNPDPKHGLIGLFRTIEYVGHF